MRMKGPENCGGFTHGGVAYDPDADGCIEIDDQQPDGILAAMSHSFTPIEQAKRGRRKKSEVFVETEGEDE